eukprot:TRINITY_DN31212_c0_g1_i1.p1 TRINITY_DN31212_c0_g1~~TRINITY_DN31212_c0_g1_i1.p1  ORF type:complete len:171 (+),score=40.76 TRINITY_DN31212_c0_g1_i1:28-540(+)
MELNVVKEGTKAIVPPRLEDAGLEDCALSIDGIKEAFSKAAEAFKSRVCISQDDTDDCLEDSGPSNGEWSDALQGNAEIPAVHGDSCAGSRVDGVLQEGRDELLGFREENAENYSDEIIDGVSAEEVEKRGSCVQGLEGLGASEKRDEVNQDEDVEGRDKTPPTLVEGYV